MFAKIVKPLQSRSNEVLAALLPKAGKHQSNLAEAMRYAVLSPGKRIRPVLTYLTGQALGVPLTTLDNAAASVEFFEGTPGVRPKHASGFEKADAA